MEANAEDMDKKKEELRTVEQNIRILESGGEVEDQEVTLNKNLQNARQDLQTTQAKVKIL